jgi:hypothetical protein
MLKKYRILSETLMTIIMLYSLVHGQESQNTTLIGSWARGPCYTVEVSGNIAYFGNGFHLEIMDISNPSYPVGLGRVMLPGTVKDVEINGNYAYVACGTAFLDPVSGLSGLSIIDISNPASPSEVGFYEWDNEAFGVAVSGNYAYLSTGYVQIIDISNPADPTWVGCFSGIRATDMVISGNYAYAIHHSGGLRILNISNPTSPTEIESYDINGSGVAINGNYAYVPHSVGYSASALSIIDISDPFRLTKTGTCSLGGTGERLGVAVSGNYAYVADGTDGLRIIDISDPANPTEVGFEDTNRYHLGGSAEHVEINGNYAYLADSEHGLRIIDIS